MVIDTGDGILLKPTVPFQATDLTKVAGLLKKSVQPKTDEEIKQALKMDLRSKWHAKR